MKADRNESYWNLLLEKYVKGTISQSDRLELEKQALDDPLLFEAIQGFSESGTKVSLDRIKSLESKFQPKENTSSLKFIPWIIRAAAVGLILIACVFVFRQVSNESEITNDKIVVAEEKQDSDLNNMISSNDIKRQDDDSVQNEDPIELKESPSYGYSQSIQKEEDDEEEKLVDEKLETPNMISEPPSSPVQYKTTQNQAQVMDSEIKEESHADHDGINESESLAGNQNVEKIPSVTTDSVIQDVDKNYAVKSKDLFASGLATIHGIVTDLETGEPLIGANVQIKGTELGALTDLEGNYAITVPYTNPHLQFSYFGYGTIDYALQGTDEVNISLELSEILLEEIVVSGSGTKHRIQHTEDGNISATPAMGWAQLELFIEENLAIPQTPEERMKAIKQEEIEQIYKGSVELEFRVTPTGILRDFKILSSTCPICEDKAIRILKRSGRWLTDPEGEEVLTSITIIF